MADESKYESEYYQQQIMWFCTIFQDAPWLNECEPLAHVVNALYQSIVEIDELTDSGNQQKGSKTITQQRGDILVKNLKLELHSGGQSDMSKSRKQREIMHTQIALAKQIAIYRQQGHNVDKSVIQTLKKFQMDSSQYDRVRQYYYKHRKLVENILEIQKKTKKLLNEINRIHIPSDSDG